VLHICLGRLLPGQQQIDSANDIRLHVVFIQSHSLFFLLCISSGLFHSRCSSGQSLAPPFLKRFFGQGAEHPARKTSFQSPGEGVWPCPGVRMKWPWHFLNKHTPTLTDLISYE